MGRNRGSELCEGGTKSALIGLQARQEVATYCDKMWKEGAYNLIPVVPVANFQRDGFATFVSQGARPNYHLAPDLL
jgi:hypothetical protein